MTPIILTAARARAIILHAAGLSRRGQFGKGMEAAYKVVEQLGFVQVDTNYVVERAHHHAIAARVPGYEPAWLQELQHEGRIYEFWTRDAGFMPMQEFRFSLPVHDSFSAKWQSLPPAEAAMMQKILDRVGREGPLTAKDFDYDRVTASSGWWDWRPSKVALERLHLTGQLLTTRKKDFHKMYDLTSNIVPADIDKTKPGIDEFSRHIIMRSLQALGIAFLKEMAWNGRHVKHHIKSILKTMVEEREVLEIGVAGVKGPLYMLPQYKNKKITIAGDAFILSPFDILNVFRHRLRNFFNFDYQVECFVPEAKRKYGYFSLPVLIGDVFVARMDAKADRKQRILIIHNLHTEQVAITNPMLKKLADALRAFALFNGCASIVITTSNNRAVLKTIREMLNAAKALGM